MYFIAQLISSTRETVLGRFLDFFFRYEREANGIRDANIHEHKHIALDTLHNTI